MTWLQIFVFMKRYNDEDHANFPQMTAFIALYLVVWAAKVCVRQSFRKPPSFWRGCKILITVHTASKWTFTQKKINGNFEHSPRNYMPSGSQNRFWINHWRPSEREIAIWSSILFCDTSIFQLDNMDTKKFLMNLILLLFYSWETVDTFRHREIENPLRIGWDSVHFRPAII